MSRDGGNRVPLTDGDDSRPLWSPDGRRIAFWRHNGIIVMDADGKNLHRVASGFPAAWSPDSRSILFTAGANIGSVYTVGADGRGLRRMTSGASASAVAWSAVGSKIFFDRQVSDDDKSNVTRSELWVMDADGSRQTRLSFNRPGWSVLSADLGF